MNNLTLTLSSTQYRRDGDELRVPITPEIEAQLPKAGRWKPKIREYYFYADENGSSFGSHWDGGLRDQARYSTGNVHPTEQAARDWWQRQVDRQTLYDLRDECGGFVSDGKEECWRVLADGGLTSDDGCAATEFGFNCYNDAERFLTKAGELYTRYFTDSKGEK